MKTLQKMNSRLILVAAMLLISVAITQTACNTSSAHMEVNTKDTSREVNEAGFITIFDGKTLHNWTGDTVFWSVRNGVLTGEETAANSPLLKANTFLIYQGGTPGDFELTAEYRISGEGNSGIQYRSDTVAGVPFGLRGYQMDIDGANEYTGQNYEERGRCIVAFRGQRVILPPFAGSVQEGAKNNVWSPSKTEGSLGNADSLKSLIKRDWNTCCIVARGNHLQHYINGVLVCDITDDDTANRKSAGLIGLQLHAGHIMKIEFRNIQIKTL